MSEFDPDNLAILRDEEDEPCFASIIKRAQERIKGVDFDDPHVTFELEAIRDLLMIVEHYDNTLDSYYWNMSDNGELVGTEP